MTTKTAGDRVPVADLEAIIAKALAPGDYEHDTEWVNGGPVEVNTPPEHVVNLGSMVAALPQPDHDGTVDAHQAALSILSVIETRLAPFPYTLRAHSLVKRLTEESERYEQAHGLADTGVPDTAGQQSWMPRCQYCGQPCNDKRARYCKPSHRQQAYKKRKRGQG